MLLPGLRRTLRRLKSDSLFDQYIQGLKQQASKDKELQSSLQQFKETLTDISQNETLKAAKEAFSKAKKEIVEKNQQVLDQVQKHTKPVREFIGRATAPFQRPSLEERRRILHQHKLAQRGKKQKQQLTERLHSLGSAIEALLLDESSSASLGTIKSREHRERIARSFRQRTRSIQKTSLESSDCTALVNCEQPRQPISERVRNSVRNSSLYIATEKRLQSVIKSDNPLSFLLRSCFEVLCDRFSRMFQPSEAAKATLLLRKIDPAFNCESFVRIAREFIIPEVLESILTGQLQRLKPWASESAYRLLQANQEATLKDGCVLDGSLFDLRAVEIAAMRVLDGEIPAIVLSFQTQQIMVLRDKKTGIVVQGDEEHLERFAYVWALTRELSSLSNINCGWKIVEVAVRST